TLMSVDVGTVFNGIGYTGFQPPDTIGASGYNYVIEMVNLTMRYYDKGGNQLLSTSLTSFFSPLGGVLQGSDPVIVFDTLTGQFAVGMLDYNTSNASRFDFAVSNDENPLDGWQYQRYNMNDGTGGFDFADYPKLGFNADGYFATFNMFPNLSRFDHVNSLAIDKATLTGNRQAVPGGSSNFTLVPAATLDANPGDPEWLVEANSGSGNVLKVYQAYTTGAPFLVGSIPVPSYSNPPTAAQKGSSTRITTIDDRLFNATMIYGQLLTSHTVSSGGVARARWYQIDTTQGDPYLFQEGEIDQGPGVYTYFPTIAMNYEGDIGLTFMESSSSEYLSMYVTGQSVYDWGSGAVQTPVVTHPGTGVYTSSRAGDYSGITVDAGDGYTFWAFNEYKGSGVWATGIANFGVSPNAAPVGGNGRSLQVAAFALPTAIPSATADSTSTTTSSTTTDQPATGADWLFRGVETEQADVVALGLQQDATVPVEVTGVTLADPDNLWNGTNL
ncbi:MAG TPA: hypothetical protein VGZ73_24870, partial [Bryobacteraceae bacterium]|nr:hypothetical protein [Bryobacteraceae bacterium]